MNVQPIVRLRMHLLLALGAAAVLPGCRTAGVPEPKLAAARVPACEVPPPRDTVLLRVAGSLTPADSSLPLPREYGIAVLFEVANRLRIPPALLVDTYEPFGRLQGTQPVPREPGYPAVAAVIEMRLRPGERPDQLRLVSSSLSQDFDLALAQAVVDAVADGVGVLPDTLGKARTVRLSVDTRVQPDSLQLVMFEMRAPLVEFDSLVMAKPGNPMPSHPRHLREREIEGWTIVRFVVDPEGMPVLPSLRVMRTDHPEFVDAVQASLLFSRFRPAYIEDCAVASVVEMTYRFSLY